MLDLIVYRKLPWAVRRIKYQWVAETRANDDWVTLSARGPSDEGYSGGELSMAQCTIWPRHTIRARLKP
eukprot:scaffold90234_cov32-Tisochrysis_lutea.AAC.4